MFGIVTLFVGLDTTRALLSYSAFHSSSPPSSSTIVLVSEAIKFVVALIALTLDRPNISTYRPLSSDPDNESNSNVGSPSRSSQEEDNKDAKRAFALDASAAESTIAGTQTSHNSSSLRVGIHYALPALLYLVNQILFFLALSLTSPSLTQAGIMAKLPFTGILHHFKVHRQKRWQVWASLAFACVGLYLFNVFNPGGGGGSLSLSKDASSVMAREQQLGLLALVIGLIISANSAVASVYTEIMLKQDVRFWVSQSYLYFWGMVFATLSIPLQSFIALEKKSLELPTPRASWLPSWKSAPPALPADSEDHALALETLVILLTAISGLVVARILRVASNLDKMIGFLISLVTICIGQFFLFPELRAGMLTMPKVVGCLVIVTSTGSYNYYKESPPPPPANTAEGQKTRKGA